MTLPETRKPEEIQAEQNQRRVFVLVHGTWHGSWCWRRVADDLEARGHKVFTPTLTGLADRSHLLSTAITLDTHIADIVNLFEWEDLSEVTLVAHSSAGWAVSAALEKVCQKVTAIVFLDAFYPSDGQCQLDLEPPDSRTAIEKATMNGDVGRPAFPAAFFGIENRDDALWVDAKMTPQPYGVYSTKVHLTGTREKISRKTYVRATNYRDLNFDRYLQICRADSTWRTVEIACGHDVMVDAPERLAEILINS